MAHFAELNLNNEVINVVVINNSEITDVNGQENENLGIQFLQTLYRHSRWKQTSYNGNFRKNYAGAGYKYDQERDAFIPPRPYPSWTLDENTCQWLPPQPCPEPGYGWDEDTLTWVRLLPG